MWSNGEDLNEEGDPVNLYQPIRYSAGRTFSTEDPTVSFIGGSASSSSSSPVIPVSFCDSCQNQKVRLVQLYAPKTGDTYQVLGCNRASCVNALFQGDTTNQASSFCIGGNGVFECVRVNKPEAISTTVSTPTTATTRKMQAPRQKEEMNEWMVDEEEDDTMDELEQKLAAMESKTRTATSAKKSTKVTHPQNKKRVNDGLPCYEIHSLREPLGMSLDDEDDVGIVMGGKSSDDKIQNMLLRYMAQEEDEDILSLIRGNSKANSMPGASGGKHMKREKDERLSAADRAMLAFQDRIKRSPRQVLRHAPGGKPLWSIPLAVGNKPLKPMIIPKCPMCGSDRVFEFQLLPSLLHVLEVDNHAAKVEKPEATTDILQQGGMNWGAIAVYSCSQHCSTESSGASQEFCILQSSMDEGILPAQHQRQKLPDIAGSQDVVIAENEVFDDSDDELVDCNVVEDIGDNYDEDDDDNFVLDG